MNFYMFISILTWVHDLQDHLQAFQCFQPLSFPPDADVKLHFLFHRETQICMKEKSSWNVLEIKILDSGKEES